MEWLQSLGRALSYIEENLENEELNADSIAREVALSSFYFQKGFSILTGFSVGEYIRNRRLYTAALDISRGSRVIDCALKYGWETPESFTKAFSRFHGITPQSVKNGASEIRVFLPLKINVSVTGGSKMDFTIEKRPEFKAIGFRRRFNLETAMNEIPKYWDEIFDRHVAPWQGKKNPETKTEKAMVEFSIGQLGVCMDEIEDGKPGEFDYLIGGFYKGGEIPEGMEVFSVPGLCWAKFTCTGPLPVALQSVNNEIYRNWLPSNGKYRVSAGWNIEFYHSEGKPTDMDYRSEIWIPVEEL